GGASSAGAVGGSVADPAAKCGCWTSVRRPNEAPRIWRLLYGATESRAARRTVRRHPSCDEGDHGALHPQPSYCRPNICAGQPRYAGHCRALPTDHLPQRRRGHCRRRHPFGIVESGGDRSLSRRDCRVTPLLELRDVSAGYVAGIDILRGVNLAVAAGAITGLIGLNGAGKSTIMKTICGFLRPRTGVVEFDGTDISAMAAHRAIDRGICYIPQESSLFAYMTVQDNL